MEKIKSVLSGHKKTEETTHDAPTSSTGASQPSDHPIYDNLSSSSAHPTTANPSTSAGQTTTSGAPLGSHSTVTGGNTRPDVNPGGAGHMHTGMSEASIKSGVIGFGSSHQQEHAALPSHNPESDLDRNQILGGGSTGRGPTTADTSEQPSALKQALPVAGNSSDQTYNNSGATTQGSTSRQPFDQSLRQESYTNDTDRSFPLAGGVAPKHDPSSRHTTEHQPTEHHTSRSTDYPTQQTTSTHHPATSAREPGTKEKEVGVHDGQGHPSMLDKAKAALGMGAAGGAAGAASQSHQRDVPSQGQEARQATYGDQPSTSSVSHPSGTTTGHLTQSHHPEGLAAAAAVPSTSSTLSPSGQGYGMGAQDSSLGSTSRAPESSAYNTQPLSAGVLAGDRPSGNRSESYRHVPGGFPSPTPDESKTFLYYRDEVVPEPGVEAPVYRAHKGIHPEHLDAPEVFASSPTHGSHAASSHPSGTVGSGPSSSTAGPHKSDLLNKADPRVDSDLNGSRTAPGQFSNMPTGTSTSTNMPIGSSTSTSVPSGQHELRHTGSLEQPHSRSSDLPDEHHHGRDAAIAGGVGAGAAGLGYAATRDRDAPHANVGSSNLSQDSSPYSSKQLDPRALGSKANLAEQRYDPQATSHHISPTSNVVGVSSPSHGHHDDKVGSDKSTTGPHKSSLLNKLDPRVKSDSSKTTDHSATTSTAKHNEPESHHGRDAALVGGGGLVGAAGVHHELSRNDTPGTGTAVLPQEQTTGSTGPMSSSTTTAPYAANTSAPLSSSTATAPHQQSTHTSAPLSSSTTSASHPSTTHDDSSATKPFDTYHGPKTTDGTPFYGAAGAPAPLVGHSSPTSASHQPTTSSSATQQQDNDHHYGRDAGLVGAGAATAGGLAYAGQHNDRTNTGPASSTIGPHSSNVANVLDPRVQPNPAQQKDHTTAGPHQSDTLNRMDPKVDEKHHYGRDAAVVGGTGAAGYGAYEAAQAYGSHPSTQPSASMNEQRYVPGTAGALPPHSAPTTGLPTGPAVLGGRHADVTHMPASLAQPHDPAVMDYPTQSTTAPSTTQHQSGLAQDPRDKDHTTRNAALLGTAGAAAGGAAYAHSQDQDTERERARLEKEQQERLKKEQHEHDKEQKKLDKEHHKEEKAAHNFEKEQHKHDKAVAAEEKEALKHEKEQEKEAHRLEKEREKEAKRLEEENKPEKKHGILGFLHRDKSKKDRSSMDESPRQSAEVRRSVDGRQSVDNKRHSKEYAAGAAGVGALGAGTTAAAYDENDPNHPRWKGKNLLHKDPPPGHPARDALEHHEMGEMHGGKREHIGTDGPIGDPNAISGMHETHHNTYGAQPLSEIGQDRKVIEPHTGLPMNVGKYGDGHGGTDGNRTIHGVHEHGGQAGMSGAGTAPGAGTDWSAVKKADTPY